MNKFKKDPFYLLKYCLKTILILSILSAILFLTRGFDLSFNFETWMIILPILGAVLCGYPSSILHNCAHGNTGTRLQNDLVGEILGTVMLYGFGGFRLGHMFHHKFPDDPLMDPHPPRGYSFFFFLLSPVKATLGVIERSYFSYFGENKTTRTNIQLQKIAFNISIILRVLFWYLLLGSELFVLFYIPMYVLNIFVFAHINYATHIVNDDGSSEIVNLNNNYYYKIVNKISFGGYFHKNHHRRPQVYNPSKIQLKNDVDYITYIPTNIQEDKKPSFIESLLSGLTGVLKS
ncbi:hypothetical protein A9Q84_00525 [Halobacteriovorax marinus]|uniref:Fatty acid desaturase domain-containing protein n=1 Tax=Halobacteriovorax marinus TaxID=97084 RepID=A0A1Y5FI62_9BACT|nr:hypothetical protein A9Q84_00525 [Halobacteriovorax marinus]